MIKKIISIKNVGTFRNCQSDMVLQPITLIHGENGRGKTTLCTIFRSLQSGNPDLILERQTLDSKEAPEVELLLDDRVAQFKDGMWTGGCKLELFDAAFVAENVHSGDLITIDHKRNLCRVILGARGALLAKRFDACDEIVQKCSGELKAAKEAIAKFVPEGVSVEQFLEFRLDSEVEGKIGDKKSEIRIVEDSVAIRDKGVLSLIEIPQPSPILTSTLLKTVDGITEDTEKRVRRHIEEHGVSEAWIDKGLQGIGGDCPFCAQSLTRSDLVSVFRTFFSQAYRDFQRELSQLKGAVDGPLSETVLLRLQKLIGENGTLAEFWGKYVSVIPTPVSFERVQAVVHGLREALGPLVAKKLESPLEKVGYSESAMRAIEEWKALRDEIQTYNRKVGVFNQGIETVKLASVCKDLKELKSELVLLEGQKLRYEPPAQDVVRAYFDAMKEKDAAESLKAKAKEDLNVYNETMIDEYRDTVNDLLARFGTAFTIANIKLGYTGRAPRTAYTFEMRGVEIDPGSEKSVGIPCFRNTLSAGDRSTLALAFFMAQLKNRKDLADLTVVFDDPFTSLDLLRQQWTCNQIAQLAMVAKQVIVLSHSVEFLRMLSQVCDQTKISTLQIERQGPMDSRIILDLQHIPC